jgi:hypothetical protein
VALQLKRQGITRVRPLQGGLRLWKDAAFPLAALDLNREQLTQGASGRTSSPTLSND